MTFREELEVLLEKHKRNNISDTPDYVLAKFMTDCLTSFECAIGVRESLKSNKKR